MRINFTLDGRVANKVGVKPALIFASICYWIEKNETNGTNFHDGCYWTYNSYDAFVSQFYFFSKKEIRDALKKLREADFIKIGEYNKSRYDRTLWYAISEKGMKYYINKDENIDDTDEVQRIGLDSPIDVTEESPLYIYNNINNTKPKYYQSNTQNNTIQSPMPGRCESDQKSFDEDKSDTETKHKHGQYGHVLLTDTEYGKLTNTFGQADADGLIQFLDDAIEMKGYKYKNHYLVIVKENNWVREEYFKKNRQPRTQYEDEFRRY